MGTQRRVNQFRLLGTGEERLPGGGNFDLGLEGQVDIQEGEETKEKDISGRKYRICKYVRPT